MEEIKNRQMPEEDAAEQETNASAGTENVGEESGEAKAAGETAENAAGQDSSKESGPAGQEGPGGKEEPSEGASEGKKGFFWKKDKKDPRDEKIEELTDRLKRSMAEFDNFRKRTEKEKASMYEIGARDVIEKILPIVDNFERGLAAIPEDSKERPFAEGMEKIYRQFMKTLEEMGVTPIEAVGKEFDPNFHNAVMHIEDENLGENIVAQELQKGYMYRDSVVRHSMVQVAN